MNSNAKFAVSLIVLTMIVSASLYFSSPRSVSAWGPLQSSTVAFIDICRFDSPPIHCTATPDNMIVLKDGVSFSTVKNCPLKADDPVNYRVSSDFSRIRLLDAPSDCQPL